MRKALFALSCSALFVIGTQSAHAALNSYLQLKGSKTAKFNPSVQSGWYQALCTNDTIVSPRDSIVSPRDPASGQATGKRTHMPLRMRMYYDQASVAPLKLAFANKEPIPSATLLLYRPAAAKGSQQVYMQIELKNVQITSYQVGVLDGRPTLMFSLLYEEIARRPANKIVALNAWKQGFTLGN